MSSIMLAVAGMIFFLSVFVFADGWVIAKQMGVPYNFLMWLPAIMILCGGFLLRFVDGELIADVNYSLDEDESPRGKILFFCGVSFILAGLIAAFWKAIDSYANNSSSWPGVSIVLQGVLLTLCFAILFTIRMQRGSELE